MKREFLAAEYSDLEVQFCIKEREDENKWVPIWTIHPEEITLVEMGSCDVCEIKASPQMGADVFFNFKVYLLENGFLKKGMLLNIKTDSENQQYFLMFTLETVEDGFAACILGKEEITLDSTPAEKKYSVEEEAFFSQFRKEEHD